MHLKPRRIAFEECLVQVQVRMTPLNVQVRMARFTKKGEKKCMGNCSEKLPHNNTYVQN